jgi:hypothetical protein
MTLSKRERYILISCMLAGAIFVTDRLALGPYLDQRAALLDQKQQRSQKLNDATQLLNRERRLRRLLAAMGPSVEFDPSAAEVQLLHLLHDWEQQSGVGNSSFHRVRAVEVSGFTHLTFQVSAGGDMGAVALLLYAVETAAIPLRIDDLHLTPKKDGNELQVQMVLSTICQKKSANAKARETVLAPGSMEVAGGKP